MTMPITIVCLLITCVILYKLTVIDLKVRLLPNVYVGAFFLCGVAFHGLTNLHYITLLDAAIAILLGGGMLLLIRTIANRYYGFGTLGLGDVKLIGAAGLWLGTDFIFLAISIGAFAGLLHGIAYGYMLQQRSGEKVNFAKLSIPAGPGFIAGIIITACIKFSSLPTLLF